MADEGSDPAVHWLVLICPSCGSKGRAREASAPKALRCPRCRAVIRSASVQPEPAPAQRVHQSLSKQPAPLAPVEEPEDIRYTARDPESVRPADLPEPDAFEDIEVRRKRPPAPVSPLWSGVYGFPWHPTVLRAWFLFGIGLSLVALMAAALHYVLDLYLTSNLGGIAFRVYYLYMKGFVLFLLWTGAYAGGFFLGTIQETAAGNHKVGWPDDSVWSQLFTFFYLVWIFLCAAVPFGIAVSPLTPFLGYAVFGWSLVPSTILVFPIVLLCVLANDSWWMLGNREVLHNLLLRPQVVLILYLMSVLLLGPCVALGYLTIMDYGHFLFLAPLTGFVWSACLLIYGRLLGRVGWIITEGQELANCEARRRRKRRRQPTS